MSTGTTILPHPAPFPVDSIRAALELVRNRQLFRDDPGLYVDHLILALHWAGHAVFGDPKAMRSFSATGRITEKWDVTGLHKVRKISDAQARRALEELLRLHDEEGDVNEAPKPARARKRSKAAEEAAEAEAGSAADEEEGHGVSAMDTRAAVAAGVGAFPIGPLLWKFLLTLLQNLSGA